MPLLLLALHACLSPPMLAFAHVNGDREIVMCVVRRRERKPKYSKCKVKMPRIALPVSAADPGATTVQLTVSAAKSSASEQWESKRPF